jgi:arylsulfatase A-like enzyme
LPSKTAAATACVSFLVLVVCLDGCAAKRSAAPIVIRLVDLYKPGAVENRTSPAPPPPRTEWRFDGPAPPTAPPRSAATRGWEPLHGVSGLAVKDGKLIGRATDALPILHFERTSGLDEPDLVHEIQVRLRVSAGANLSLGFSGDEKLDADQALDYARNLPPDFTTPIVPGDEFHTYTLKTTLHVLTSRTRHVFIQPTDRAGATFAIESVRLVSRKEHLASVPSGIGWQGLGEVYRDTIVSRSPEKIRLRLFLPQRPRLELAVGTVEDTPVTFRVAVGTPGTREDQTVLERTVTRAHRWEGALVDLAAFAGREVSLSLSASGDRPGLLGFWGGPTVRSRGAEPQAPAAATPTPAPQGVILIWADTLRRDHVGAYGDKRPTTPNLDRMAAQGTLFRDCVGQATWTKVATPSLLTSLYPTTHTVRDFFDLLPAGAITLAEIYRKAGYATLSFSSILFTGKFTNLHRGFEEVHEGGSLPNPDSSKTSREYVDRLLPWLEAHRDVPFFVFLHVADPHDPYRPYAPYDTLFADAARNEQQTKDDKAVLKVIADPLLRHMGSPMPTREELLEANVDPQSYVGHDRNWYDGSIRGMDAEIGRILERLRGLGLAGRTLVVFTADHGEEFLDHGRTFHGQSVYGELNNLPLILWRPGAVPAGAVVERTVETIDVMPTLLQMGGLELPVQAQGQSLVPLITAAAAPGRGGDDGWTDRPAISEKAATPSASGGSPPPRDTESFAIVWRGWKLIHNTKRHDGQPEFELYDHRGDPLDQKDLASTHPEIVQKLAHDLEAWHRKAESARLKPDSTSGKALSQEELERLRSLGYIQ